MISIKVKKQGEKNLIMKKAVTVIICVMILFVLSGCGKSESAQKVDDLILTIGEVTKDSEAMITEAEEYYSILTEKQKNEVEYYKTLVDARKAFDMLIAQNNANEIIEAINDLGGKKSYTQEELTKVMEQYEKLNDLEKELVTNYSELESVIKTPTSLEQIAVNLVEGLINELYNPSAMEIFSISIQDGTTDKRFKCALVEMDYNGTNKLGGTVRKAGNFMLWGEEAEYISLMSDCNASIEVYAEYLKLSTKMRPAVDVDPDRILALVENNK